MSPVAILCDEKGNTLVAESSKNGNRFGLMPIFDKNVSKYFAYYDRPQIKAAILKLFIKDNKMYLLTKESFLVYHISVKYHNSVANTQLPCRQG